MDATESLVSIADLAGGEWPSKARTALASLCSDAQKNDESIGVKLLSDIRQVFEEKNIERISSTDLATALAEIETSPWCEWSKGKPITSNKVARLLKPYGIEPAGLRIKDRSPKGYYRHDFEESWRLYLPQVALPPMQSATPQQTDVTPSNESTCEVSQSATTEGPVALSNPPNPNGIKDVADVALSKPPEGQVSTSEDGFRIDDEGCFVCIACEVRFRTWSAWRAHKSNTRCVFE
jgi:hypothetical protein